MGRGVPRGDAQQDQEAAADLSVKQIAEAENQKRQLHRPVTLAEGGANVGKFVFNRQTAVFEKLNEGEKVQSPGMKYKHYAPKAEVTLVVGDTAQYTSYVNANAAEGCMALCFAEDVSDLRVENVVYGEAEHPEQQAQLVFSALRELDERGAKTVLAHCPQTTGVALAVYNRLLRAAAFRVIQL